MKKQNVKIAAGILLVLSLLTASGCRNQNTPGAAGSESPATDAAAKTSRVSPSQLQDGDRIVIADANDTRVLSELPDSSGYVSVSVECRDGTIDVLPLYTMVLTCEKTPEGNCCFKTDNGYLAAGSEGTQLLLQETKDRLCEWNLNEEGLFLNLGQDVRRYLQHVDAEHFFEMAELAEGGPEMTGLHVFRLASDSEPLMFQPLTGYSLPVIETTDLHGYYMDDFRGQPEYRLPYIAGVMDSLRSRLGTYRRDILITLDGGDFYQGNAPSNLMYGAPISAAYDAIGYDAVTIGNHEFDWVTKIVFDDDATMGDYEEPELGSGRNEIPVILSNLYQNGEKVPYAQDYVILQKTAVDENGDELPVRVAVIGYADDYSDHITRSNFLDLGFELRDEFENVKQLARTLKEENKCEAVILLAHEGVDELKEKVTADSGIDAVFCGHTHMSDVLMSPGGIPMVMPKGYGRAYCEMSLYFEKKEDGTAGFRGVTDVRPVPVDRDPSLLYDTPENQDHLQQEVLDIAKKTEAITKQMLTEEISFVTSSVLCNAYFPESGERGSTGGNLYTEIMRRAGETDAAFINLWGMRSDILLKEKEDRRIITNGDILQMFPFHNRLYVYEVTLAEFKTLLDYTMTEAGTRLMTIIGGVDVYYSSGKINAIIRNGNVLYENGVWNADETKETITFTVSEYLATTDLADGNMHNPLVEWLDQGRVIRSIADDCQAAIAMLKEMAAENNGEIPLDTHSYFIEGAYPLQ